MLTGLTAYSVQSYWALVSLNDSGAAEPRSPRVATNQLATPWAKGIQGIDLHLYGVRRRRLTPQFLPKSVARRIA